MMDRWLPPNAAAHGAQIDGALTWVQAEPPKPCDVVLTVLGARFLVSAAVEMSQALGVSETIIGLTVISAGTT